VYQAYSVDSNEPLNSGVDHKDGVSDIEEPSSVVSALTPEYFAKEAEQMSSAQLLSEISKISKDIVTRGLEKKDLIKLYVDWKTKKNNDRRLSQLDQEIKAEVSASAPGKSASPGKDKVRPADEEHPSFNDSLGKNKGADTEFIKLILDKKSFPLSGDQMVELKALEGQRVSKLKQHKKTYLRNKIMTNREFNSLAVARLIEWGFDPASAAIPASSSFMNAEELAELNETSANVSNVPSTTPAVSTTTPVLGADMIKSQSGHMNPVKLSARTKEAISEIDKDKLRSSTSSHSNQGSRNQESSGKKGSKQEDLADLESKMTQFLNSGLANASPNPQKY
jgi:hypothetical protein